MKEFFRDSAEPEDRQVVVVGAGPAGATAARFAAEAGADVLLIDRKSVVGSPVQCAGYLPSEEELADMLPDVPEQDQLYRVDDRFELARSYETLIVSPDGRRTYLRFEGLTIDRARWDPHLVDLAVKAGAEFRPSTQAMRLESGVLFTDRGTYLPGVVISADGPHSRIRRTVGLPDPKLLAPALNAPSKHLHGGKVEMHFARESPGAYAWVIPAGDGISHVGLGADPRRKGVDLKANLAAFADKVGAELGPVTGGFVPSAGPVKRTVKGNVMLVGDAAGHVMASNGGGVPIGLATGRAAGLVAADVVKGKADIADYERRWRTEVGDVLATAARFRWAAGLQIWSPLAMEMAMWAMPKDQMLRALKCQRIFNAF
ncbi:MAG: geranylgeranyl reductase family protein [Thermoplasmata archaeon]|nr:geranylgeranyl reductase family protein [Thermoplasmata archaeon]NIS11240.1 geranylgeranyl reductase family protein [Thermoplasmata archaeon]NIS19174.1 geranylgeranyl reductase family protein [Thermoplasmata archaeon]NIT76230.1 geranylgeranyl reductase family protein [Thermoplasmata archaeon]NIU48308.1 geranylgeranyl reductase family protein [Thermoplasmata archaeon]